MRWKRKEKAKLSTTRLIHDAKRKRGFIDTWLTDFPWLEKLQTADDLCICKLCKQFPILADQSSSLFIGQPIFRRDTLVAHEKSSCHARCKIKCDDELILKVRKIKIINAKYKYKKIDKTYGDYLFGYCYIGIVCI